jgi:hypothetical protein
LLLAPSHIHGLDALVELILTDATRGKVLAQLASGVFPLLVGDA